MNTINKLLRGSIFGKQYSCDYRILMYITICRLSSHKERLVDHFIKQIDFSHELRITMI